MPPNVMNSPETLRRFYARLVTASAGIAEPRIVNAFATVRREQFIGPGPWQIAVNGGYMAAETDDPIVLYQDIVVGLFPDRRINNGEPSLHAKCLGAVCPTAGEVVIHVGAGTGYYTAILAELVGVTGRVHAYEIEADIARRAVEHLTHYTTVIVHARSALEGPLPSADVIYVNAGATHVPLMWLDALAPGGRLILPLTPDERLGCMVMVTRVTDAHYAARIVSPAAFVPCVGARDHTSSRALAAALDTRAPEEVHSLQRNTPPDATAWCVGDGWWLSTATHDVGEHGASQETAPSSASF
jgi:protein-L-isoaspartate(D-aspartate) O-methyltransferase